MADDKNRKEGYYWVKINDKWEPAFWNTKNWKIIYFEKPTIVDEVGSFIGAYGQSSHEELAVLPLRGVVPSAFYKMTDKELEQAEQNKLNEIAELHKQWKAILNEQFYRKHPECKPH